MIAICVDDEPILLNWLVKLVSASPDIDRAEKFTDELDALDFAAQHPFDIAFLDIELHDVDGVAVAQRLREINPDCGIIFCTGHAGYAVKAISQVLVDGYLLKPIRANAVQHEIDRLKARRSTRQTLLTVDLLGGVNIFDQTGNSVHFRRRKTEDLFALLVRQNGESLSFSDLCELLWEDSKKSAYLREKNENYLAQLFTDLRRTLKECEAQDVLKKTADGYAMCMSLIKLH